METEAADRLRVTRTFTASRQRVFRAWTEPELMMRWFVEGDMEMSVCEIDLREGGTYRLEGHMGDKRWSIWGAYKEVRPPERLVYTWTWKHDAGFGEPEGDTLVTVEFRERGKETELVLTHERFTSAQARKEHAGGWKSCLDRFEKVVA
ncbi:MAG TPA: SRPBCC domain-containing protein [Thermoanaerobaculia bacterium]|jgi:uncharacterized protein YndB with AHSA1/START domain|nr:SRPBCC domain-containing protein [Thermoanaerobaculia bacterium]